MTTGEKIRKARKDAGITQAELASKMGISAAGVAQWENNLRMPKIGTIQKIATVLNVPWPELYSDDEKVAMAYIDSSKFVNSGVLDARTSNALKTMRYVREILDDFELLNEIGQEEAAKRVHELTQIPTYQCEQTTEHSHSAAGDAPEDTAPKKD